MPKKYRQIHSKPPSSSSSSSITKLQTVKITSPTKGQQVPIGENLAVFGITGTAVGSTALSQCQVFVIANSVKPYQPATGTGPGGAADYSKWNFVLTSKYTTIKSGPDNKITAKYICSNNPSAVSYYSVNVTGGATSTSAGASNNNISPPTTTATVSKQQGQPVTTTGNNSVGGNSTMTSTSSALHPTKLVYLGINKRLSHNHGIVPPIDQAAVLLWRLLGQWIMVALELVSTVNQNLFLIFFHLGRESIKNTRLICG